MLSQAHFWTVPLGQTSITAALQGDLSTAPTGHYGFILSSGVVRQRNERAIGTTSGLRGTLRHVNQIDSVFGAGWSIDGLQQIYRGADGTAFLVDGDGSESVFMSAGFTIGDNGRTLEYENPPGDFSVLVAETDRPQSSVPAFYRRSMPDGTVYIYEPLNSFGVTRRSPALLTSITDRNGNTTQYIYNADRDIERIIDPVGLETVFDYTNGKVSRITDPAGRETLLEYDNRGNLKEITDPDGSSRSFEYDDLHHLTAETDKRGFREQTVYDFAGRVTKSIRKDGTEMFFNPVQTQVLYRPEQTVDLDNSPPAFVPPPIVAEHVDANGNVSRTVLDNRGQNVLSFDEIGRRQTIVRNQDTNLILEVIDARGFITQYEYDDRGNVIEIRDEISGIELENLVYWSSHEDGDWGDAANWSTGQVPGPEDNVIIDVPEGELTITNASGNRQVKSIQTQEDLVFSGGSLTINGFGRIHGDLTLGSGRTLTANGINSFVTITGDTTIDGATVVSADGATINMPTATSLTSGVIDVNGVGSIIASNMENIDNTRIFVSGGGQVSVSVPSYQNLQLGSGEIFSVTGQGSVLDLSSVETANFRTDIGTANANTVSIVATNGGVIDFGSLESIASRRGRDRLDLIANSGGDILLSSLETIESGTSRIRVGEGSLLTEIPALVSTSGTSLLVGANQTLDLPSLTAYSSGLVALREGGTINAPQLDNFTRSRLELDLNESFNTLPLTNIDNSLFFVSGGAEYRNIAAAAYENLTLGGGTMFQATGEGSVLDLSSIETANLRTDVGSANSNTISIVASDDGTIDLSGLQSFASRRGLDRLDVISQSGGNILLPSLTTIESGTTRIRIREGAALSELPALTTTSGASLLVSAGQTLDLPVLSNYHLGIVTLGDGATINAPQLDNFTRSRLELGANQTFNTLPLTDIDDSVFRISGGAEYRHVAATSYENLTLLTGTVFQATGEGTVLDLSTIETANLRTDVASANAHTISILASDSGLIDLSSLSNLAARRGRDRLDLIARDGGTVDTSGLAEITERYRLIADGDDALLDISNLGQVTGTASSIRPVNAGTVKATNITIASGALLLGYATLEGNVTNSSLVNPGSTERQLTIDGDYSQTTDGELAIEISGISDADFDRLVVSGTATLGGELSITIGNSFAPTVGDTFEFMSFASRVGEFDDVTGLEIGGVQVFELEYGEMSVTARVIALPPAAAAREGNGLATVDRKPRQPEPIKKQDPPKPGKDDGNDDKPPIVQRAHGPDDFATLPRRFTFDPKFSQLESATDELGRQTLYEIDSDNGNTMSVTQVMGELDSADNSETDDLVTRYTYTSHGQIDTMTNPRKS